MVDADRDQRLERVHLHRLGGGPCNDDQGSDPVVGPDGTIYVVFANGNMPGDGIEQVLIVKCPASADCSNAASWTAPAKVGDMSHACRLGPPSQNGCPNRQCLPPNGYRLGTRRR